MLLIPGIHNICIQIYMQYPFRIIIKVLNLQHVIIYVGYKSWNSINWFIFELQTSIRPIHVLKNKSNQVLKLSTPFMFLDQRTRFYCNSQTHNINYIQISKAYLRHA